MNRKLLSRRRKNRTGAAAVELAIVLPLFFLVIFGMIEFGRGMMAMQIITNAAREGARACAVSPLTESEVATICSDYAEACGISGLSTEVSPDPTTAIRGEPVAVNVSVNFSDIAWLPPFWAKNTVLRSASTMRKEREFD